MTEKNFNLQLNTLLMGELSSVAQSPEFVRSPIMSKLLDYLVRQRISNPDNPPKAYHVAVEALGKPENFDVQSDSYPRVQVGRLRNMLKTYYATRGLEQRLTIPIGNYLIEENFGDALTQAEQTDKIGKAIETGQAQGVCREAEAEQPKLFRSLYRIAHSFKRGLSVTVAGFAALSAVIWLSDGAPTAIADYKAYAETFSPKVAPKIFISASENADNNNPNTNKISSSLYSTLSRFELLRVAMDGETPFVDEKPNAYKLTFKIVDLQNGENVEFLLVYIDTGELIWSDQITFEKGTHDSQEELASLVSGLGSIYGVIASDQRKRLLGQNYSGYSCILKFDEYRATRDKNLLPVVDACVEKSLRNNANNSQILAAASFMSYLREEATGRKPDKVAGLNYAQKAIVRGRDDAIASFALARSSFFSGNCSRAKRYAEQAVSKNPLESTLQAQTGAYLSACDDPDAESYLRRAMKLDPHGSIIAETGLVLTLLSQDRNSEALEIAENIMPSSTSIGPYYDLAMAMVYAKNGLKSKSETSWRRLYRVYASDDHEQAETMMSRLITNKKLGDRALEVLREANVISS